MVWTEIKLSFNPPPLHMTSLWCTSHRELPLVRRAFSCVTCSQSELLDSASTPTGLPVVERVRREREKGKCTGFLWMETWRRGTLNKPKYWHLATPHLPIAIFFPLSVVRCSLSVFSCSTSRWKLRCKIRINISKFYLIKSNWVLI